MKDISTYGNAEFVGTVNLKSADIKAGTHTVTVEYGGAKLVNTIVLLKDSSKTATAAKTKVDASSDVTALKFSFNETTAAAGYNFRTGSAVTGATYVTSGSKDFDKNEYFADVTIKSTDYSSTLTEITGLTGDLFKVRLNLGKDSVSVDSFTKLFKAADQMMNAANEAVFGRSGEGRSSEPSLAISQDIMMIYCLMKCGMTMR